MLSDPQTVKEGTQMAKEAILSREVSADAILGQLIRLQITRSPVLPDVLDTTLRLEEQHPGSLPLSLLPFFTRFYLDKSIPAEVATRYVNAAVRATRVTNEQLAQIPVRGSVLTLLTGIQARAQTAAPDLYPEIMSRLGSMERPSKAKETRQAADERIRTATDPLEQTIQEAKSTSVPLFRKQFLYQAAGLAHDRKEIRRAAELALQAEEGSNPKSTNSNLIQLDNFLNELVRSSVTNKEPDSAAFVISKISQPPRKAKALRILGETHGRLKQEAETKQAFFDAAKQIRLIEDDDLKVAEWFLLAQDVVKYTPSESFEVFKELVKTVNNLSLTNDKSQNRKLIQLADNLVNCFGSLAVHDRENAINLAISLKVTDFRLAALCGVLSRAEASGGF